MKAYSAVLVTRDYSPDDDHVFLYFDDWEDGEVERNAHEEGSPNVASIGGSVQVGGTGVFDSPPAHIVHLREATLEDKGRGSSEIDNWNINSRVDRDGPSSDYIHIAWETPERRSKVEEIGVLVIGE